MLARRLFAVLAIASLALACTGEPEPSTPPVTSSPSSAPPTVDTGDVRFQPGEWRYLWNEVDIRFSLRGNGGTLQIRNGSARRVAAPGLYAILGDGTRRDATIPDAAPVPVGERASFDVSFPDDVDETSVGLVVLLIGSNNWGALAPLPVAD